MQQGTHDETYAALSAVFREEAGRLVGALVRILGNFEIAEEIVQDALLVALERWPVEGIPVQPGAWLLTVARAAGPSTSSGAMHATATSWSLWSIQSCKSRTTDSGSCSPAATQRSPARRKWP